MDGEVRALGSANQRAAYLSSYRIRSTSCGKILTDALRRFILFITTGN